jgi:hypothetical protein
MTLNIPSPVQQAFDAVLAFQLPKVDDSALRDEIRSHAETESHSTKALLLNEQGLTEGMLSTCISPIHQKLTEFNTKSDHFDAAVCSHLPEVNISQIKNLNSQIAAAEQAKAQAPAQIEAHYARQTNTYASTKAIKDNADTKYATALASNNGIYAQDFSTISYILILMGFGAVEMWFNYRAFYQLYSIPAMAGGFTLVVAGAIGWISHWHGTRLKSIDHYFGRAVSPVHKNREIRATIAMTIALFLAISYVGYVRFSSAIQISEKFSNPVGSSIMASANLPQIHIGQDVMASLAANILVWVLGAALAYTVHDKNPDYTTLLRQKKIATKQYEQHWKAIDKQVEQKQADYDNQIQGLTNTAKMLKQDSRPIGDWLDAINDKHRQHIDDTTQLKNGLIKQYQTTLCNLADVNNSTLKFNYGGRLIDLKAYRQLAINSTLEG